MNERKIKNSMIWNVQLPRRATSIRRVLLVFLLFALFFHYHLLRKLILFDIQKDDFKETPIHILSQQHRRLHPPQQSRNQTTRIINDNQAASRFQTIPSSRRIKVNLLDATSRNWAYAFLVSGCSEEKPGYKGFLYNIVVSAKRLKEMGSVADIVVMIQMSESTGYRTIPLEEENMLVDNGIKIRYLPKMRSSYHECFYALVQEKFRILQLTEYSRVIFIDADIMPLCNLDYIFELSEPADDKLSLLKENVIIAWRAEAANAGFFMMKPNNDDWEQLQREIRRKEEKALSLPWPHWDKVEGWGHKIIPPDYWRSLNGTKLTAWDWHAVFADQGLLYYYTKYVKKNVSIIIGQEIEQWSLRDGGDVSLEKIDSNPFGAYSCFPLGQMAAPYRDYFHFTGRAKPWECDLRTNISVGVQIRSDGSEFEINRKQAEKINQWRSILLRVQKDTTTYNFTLSWSEQQSEPPLGRFSTYPHMARHIKLKKFHKWNHYEDEPPIASKNIE